MIVLDGSALFAILLGEEAGPACRRVVESDETLLLSAASLHELLVVAAGKGIFDQMQSFVAKLEPTVVPLTEARACSAAEAYRRWGKGFHPAKLNLADTFAYALAMEHQCPLLFVGNDFAQTDIVSAMTALR